MIKGVLFYFSCTGNTKLACEYIARNCKTIEMDLIAINKNEHNKIILDEYSIIGLAAFADFFGPSKKIYTFIEALPQTKKPAFIFNTYGKVSGKTLLTMAKLLEKKGFYIAASYSLHTPENYPPMIINNFPEINAPNKREIAGFDRFIDKINTIGKFLAINQEIKKERVKLNAFNLLMPQLPRKKAKQNMGILYVDNLLCTQCELCQKKCHYDAIQCKPFPIFDESKCYGCWACFHHCPTKAIFTKKIKGKGYYSKPIPEYVNKLKELKKK